MSFETVTIGPCTLYRGDSRELLRAGVFDVADAVITDPPYGIGINKSHRLSVSRGFGNEHWDEAPCDPEVISWILESEKSAVVWGGNYFGMPPSRCFIVWDKMNDGRDFADIEQAWTNLDAVARIHRQRPMNMDGGKVHPTQKPVALMRFCIQQVPSAETVVDMFMGSGSTAVACIECDKSFIGCEIDERHFETACRRIERAWQDKCSELPFEELKPVKQLELV